MGEVDDLTLTFEAERGRLFAIAYRMLGSVAEAEDVVQEAWLAWQRAPRDGVVEPAAYLTTVVTRRCLDQLRSARTRREVYVGPWLPEPLIGAPPSAAADAADEVLLAESVRMAFLVALESLSPAERAALVLHDVFGYSYHELADILGRSQAACRQLVSRARSHVAERRPGRPADADEAQRVADQFIAASRSGDLDALVGLLHPDATLTSDGGGRVTAARRIVEGADRVARLLVGIARQAGEARVQPAVVNGAPGALVRTPEGVSVVSLEIADHRVAGVNIVRNPDKLSHLA